MTQRKNAPSVLPTIGSCSESSIVERMDSQCADSKPETATNSKGIDSKTSASTALLHDNATTRRITQVAYLIPLTKGIVYPFLKISLIAMAEKLLRTALRGGINPELAQRIDEEIFDQYANTITDAYLMRSLDFYTAFAVTTSLVAFISLVFPLSKSLSKDYLNRMEVKRLQDIIYARFILEPNSVAIDEASDLLYTKIDAVQKYWEKTKYFKVDDAATMITGLLLIFILAWDLGLACVAATIVSVIVSGYTWNKLSTPWAQQREEKQAQTNSHLIDLVVCKEVVVTQAQELQEQERLHKLLQADAMDLKKLFEANFISESVKTFTFTMITPSLFLFIYTFDRSMNRVFQLLIMIVVLDEIMRAFLAYTKHAEIEAEFARAKAGFCYVLGMEEHILFPPDFDWPPKSQVEDKKSNLQTETTDVSTDDEEAAVVDTSKTYDQLLADRLNHRRQHLRQNTEDISEMISQAFEEAQPGGELSLKNVSFGYKKKNGEKLAVMNQMNMRLKIGEHYAIMGESGVGKSTMLKALSGLHEPLEGDIYFGGDAVDTTSILWREKVAVVSQDSVFLNRTLRENLVYGLTAEKSDDEIWDALEKVKMKDRILAQPGDLDMMIEGNGSCFSGGQQQRLQIARLLLSSAPLVLLDEFTSALDPATTEEVLNVLKEFLVGKTMLMITHDVNTLVLAQQVLEMTANGVVEHGVANVPDGQVIPPNTSQR